MQPRDSIYVAQGRYFVFGSFLNRAQTNAATAILVDIVGLPPFQQSSLVFLRSASDFNRSSDAPPVKIACEIFPYRIQAHRPAICAPGRLDPPLRGRSWLKSPAWLGPEPGSG